MARLRREHVAGCGSTDAQLDAAEQRLGHPLPPDLRTIWAACDGATLWPDGDHPCRLLSASELAPARELLSSSEGPGNLLAVLQADSDYVAIDVDPASRSHGRAIDCSHETFPWELHGVCDSIWGLLRLALDSGGKEWIWPSVVAYGVDFAED